MFLAMFMWCSKPGNKEKPVSWFSNIGFLLGLQQDQNYETNMWTLGQSWFNVFIWTLLIYFFTWNNFWWVIKTMFSKFVEEKAFMLVCNISYITNWYFSSDYMTIGSNALRKFIRIVLRKRKKCVVQYLNYGNYVSFRWWDQGQIGIKLGTKHVT